MEKYLMGEPDRMGILTEREVIQRIVAKEERPDLDFKQDIDLSRSNKEEKIELTKDIIAMANSGGGLIVGGIQETAQGFDLQGMPAESLKGFDSTPLNDFVANYSAPPINATSRTVEIDGKHFGVIIVPEFHDQPHIVTKNYQGVLSEGDLLVRSSSNNSTQAGPHELRSLLNRAVARRQGALRGLLEGVIESRKPIVARKLETPERQAPFDSQKYLEAYAGFRIAELEPLQDHPQLRPMALREPIEEALVRNRTGSAIFPVTDPLYSTENRLPIGVVFEQEYTPEESPAVGPRLRFSYFDTAGYVFCADSLWEDGPRSQYPDGSVGLLSCLHMILGSIVFARKYYTELNLRGDVSVKFALESRIPRTLIVESRQFWGFRQQYSNDMESPVTVQKTISTSDDFPLKEIVTEMLREFCWFFYLDLSEQDAKAFLDHVIQEKSIVVPDDLMSRETS